MSDQNYIRRQFETQRGAFLPLEWTNVYARVYNSANLTLATGTGTVLTFNSERDDDFSMHSTVSNLGQLTCVMGGFHVFGCTVRFAANATGFRELSARINGATVVAAMDVPAIAGGAVTILSLSSALEFAVGDYVEFLGYQSSGGNLDVEAVGAYSPEAWMVRVP